MLMNKNNPNEHKDSKIIEHNDKYALNGTQFIIVTCIYFSPLLERSLVNHDLLMVEYILDFFLLITLKIKEENKNTYVPIARD